MYQIGQNHTFKDWMCGRLISWYELKGHKGLLTYFFQDTHSIYHGFLTDWRAGDGSRWSRETILFRGSQSR